MSIYEYDDELHFRTLREEGREEGLELGENRLAKLLQTLMDAGRNEDVREPSLTWNTESSYIWRRHEQYKFACQHGNIYPKSAGISLLIYRRLKTFFYHDSA